MKSYLGLWDLHYGYERDVYRHKKALHDEKAMDIALQFAQDFKPEILYLGGDILDCGAISHHNRHKPGQVDGLRVRDDATELRSVFIDPLESISSIERWIWQLGNHERWLDDIVDEIPGMEGFVDLKHIMDLDDDWEVLPVGGHLNIGKLTFLHGDQLKGGEHIAKATVIAYERSVRFGHFHTHQVYTKTSAADMLLGKTGVVVPCLCKKGPKYGGGNPNRWAQGFNFGWINADGTFNDYVAIIVDGRCIVNGKEYRG